MNRGTLVAQPCRIVEGKVRLYRDHQVNVAIDDPMFAIAYYRGKAEQYLRTVREVGFPHVQLDTHFLGKKENERQAQEDEMRYIEGIRRSISFVKRPSRSTSMLWMKSLAENGGKTAEHWGREEYPISCPGDSASGTSGPDFTACNNY